jgi:hypothetical protein
MLKRALLFSLVCANVNAANAFGPLQKGPSMFSAPPKQVVVAKPAVVKKHGLAYKLNPIHWFKKGAK